MTGGATLHGRALPHATHSERIVLSAILSDNSMLEEVRDLRPRDFYWPVHAAMFCAMLALDSRGEGITASSVYREMQRRGEAGLLAEGDGGGGGRVH